MKTGTNYHQAPQSAGPSTDGQLQGMALLRDPSRNQDTAFSLEQRHALGIEGLLPSAVESLNQQMGRVLKHLDGKPNDLERYIYLIALEERNEKLFYKTVMSDPKRFIPILYDPIVADACEEFGMIYRRPRGMYINRHMKGRIAEVLRHWPERDVRFICITTGGRILGLGDIGTNGMGIAIGKLQLYTACAAVPPHHLLPVMFDIGTSNTKLHNDPFYLGTREEPLTTAELDDLTAEFVQAVQEVFPRCCIHFEDWKGIDAIRMLDRYKERILCYNDDIQGTASVALAGIDAALNITGGTITEQRILFLGAGSAGLGIAKLFCAELETHGLSTQEARQRVALFDINGLIESSRSDLTDAQQHYVYGHTPSKDFLSVIDAFKPTVLVGVSTKAGAFNQSVIEAMSRINQRPVIFALSNPTHKAECSAEQAYTWSKGKALFAAGVQFPDFTYQGVLHRPGQANNFYIYPAIGLACFAAQPRLLDDKAFIVAAHATADQITSEQRAQGMLYPSQDDILATELTTAVHVCEYLFDSGLAQVPRPQNIRTWLEKHLYSPEY